MKQRINIMVSEEAIEQLNKQPNRSKYIESLILGGASTQSPSLTKQDLLDGLKVLENIIKSQSRGTTLDQPTERKVYNGKYLVGVEEVKPPGCLCPYERNERGLLERCMTSLECPIHA